MSTYEIARLINKKQYFKCEMCSKLKETKMYEYKSKVIVPNYTPVHFKKLCGDCIYREVYGSKTWSINKKKGFLDGQM